MRESFQAHLEALKACRACPEVEPPPVAVGVAGARIMLMGQAPGPKERDTGRPFVFTAGTTLFRWFSRIGVDEESFRERVHMSAMIRCFPGKLPGRQGDRKPSRKEMELCETHWGAEMRMLRPDLVLLVGKLAIERFIPHRLLDDVVGRTFTVEREGFGFTAVPLPHPSGLNRWIQTDHGKALLGEALNLIAAHPAWHSTFPRQPESIPNVGKI